MEEGKPPPGDGGWIKEEPRDSIFDGSRASLHIGDSYSDVKTELDERDWIRDIKTEPEDDTCTEEEVYPLEDIVFPIDVINVKAEPDDVGRTANTSVERETSVLSGVKTERDSLSDNTALTYDDDHVKFVSEHLKEDRLGSPQEEYASGDTERELRKERKKRKAQKKIDIKYYESDGENAAETGSPRSPVATYLEMGHRCQYCDKVFTRSFKLTCHLRVHSGERPFKCATCGKSFKVKEIFNRHIRVHTGERPYQCQYCGKSFNGSDDVKKHERVHTGEKPYPCKYCGRAFRDLGSIRRHEMSHMGVKNFKCDECGKLFSRGCGLRRHQRIHTGERPYQCHICLKTFPRAYTLSCHLKLHKSKK